MRRFYFPIFMTSLLVVIALIPGPILSVPDFLFLAAVTTLVTVAETPPASFRAFWARITARSRDPIPSIT